MAILKNETLNQLIESLQSNLCNAFEEPVSESYFLKAQTKETFGNIVGIVYLAFEKILKFRNEENKLTTLPQAAGNKTFIDLKSDHSFKFFFDTLIDIQSKLESSERASKFSNYLGYLEKIGICLETFKSMLKNAYGDQVIFYPLFSIIDDHMEQVDNLQIEDKEQRIAIKERIAQHKKLGCYYEFLQKEVKEVENTFSQCQQEVLQCEIKELKDNIEEFIIRKNFIIDDYKKEISSILEKCDCQLIQSSLERSRITFVKNIKEQCILMQGVTDQALGRRHSNASILREISFIERVKMLLKQLVHKLTLNSAYNTSCHLDQVNRNIYSLWADIDKNSLKVPNITSYNR